jgi:hypothetical protein
MFQRRSRMKRVVLLAMVVLLAGSVAFAQSSDKEPPKWSYIEAGYIDFNPDDGLSDDGWFAGGSVGFLKMIHVFAEYDDVGDYTFWNVGAGWHGLLGDPADLFAQVQWNDVEVDTGAGDISDDGYEIGAGVRWKVIKWLELKGQVNWYDYDQSGDDVSFNVGALFTFLGDKLGVGADYEVVDDADTLRGFVRWNFGR